MATAQQVEKTITNLVIDGDKLHRVIHGPADGLVGTEGGDVKTLAGLQREFRLDAGTVLNDVTELRDEVSDNATEVNSKAVAVAAADIRVATAKTVTEAARDAALLAASGADSNYQMTKAISDNAGSLKRYSTLAAANAALSAIANGEFVEIQSDENKLGRVTRYHKSGSALVFDSVVQNVTSDIVTDALGFSPVAVDKTLPSLTTTGTSADRTAAFNAAAGSNSTFVLAPGNYTLGTAPSVNNKTITGFGAKLDGPAYPYAADISVVNASGHWLTRGVDTGVATYTMATQLVALPSGNHSRSYESAAILASVLCYDNSTYSSDGTATTAGVASSARDYVGLDSNVFVPGGLNLQRVRVWGSNHFVQFGSKAGDAGTVDGSGTAGEFRIDNYGADSGPQQTATVKNVVCAFSGGTKKASAGYYYGRGSELGGAYSAFQAEAAACVNWGFSILSITGTAPQNVTWGVNPAGWQEEKASQKPDAPDNGRVRRYLDSYGNYSALFPNGTRRIIASQKPRVANVLDIDDWDSTGAHDNAAAYQRMVNQAAADGVVLEAPAGVFALSSTIILPDGHCFKGKYGAGFNTNPSGSSTFLLAHSGKGFTRAGVGTAAIAIENLVTRRIQPDVTGLEWAPNDHDYDYFFEDISDLRMNRIMTMNATRGIFMNGGRNHIQDWSGQCFRSGLRMDWSYDTCHISDVHLWPFWQQHATVKSDMQTNAKAFELGRVDNSFFSRIFSIWHNVGFDIGWYPGDGPNKPAGTVSKLKLSQADLDIGDIGYRVKQEAIGHTAKFDSVTMQGRDEVVKSPLLVIDGPNTRIDGDVGLSGTGANGVRMGASSSNSQVSLRTSVNDWNRSSAGFPAIEVAPGGGRYDALPGSSFISGNGGAIASGNVTVWQP